MGEESIGFYLFIFALDMDVTGNGNIYSPSLIAPQLRVSHIDGLESHAHIPS